jgi:hypothetical protein
MKKTIIYLCVVALSTASACKKDSSNAAPSSSPPTVSAPGNADGAFVALQVASTQTVAGYPVTFNIGTAAAWFGLSTSYKDGGDVTCNTSMLSKSNGGYVFQPTQDKPTGLDFRSSSVAWTGTGNSSNGISAFSYTDVSSFPTVDDINATAEVSTASSFTLSASSYVYGDSVLFVVTGPNGRLLKTGGSNTRSYTFTAADMATVGTTSGATGLLQIAPYRLNRQLIGGKNYYFIKETCVNKFVTFK